MSIFVLIITELYRFKDKLNMEYFISINNEKYGPYTLKELKERRIDASTLVMSVGSNTWTPAWQIDELRPILAHESFAYREKHKETTKDATDLNTDKGSSMRQSDKVTQSPDSPQGATAREETDEMPFVKAKPVYNKEEDAQNNALQEPLKRKKHGCLIGFLIGIAILLVVLFLTCPSTANHKETISNVVSETLKEESEKTTPIAESGIIDKAFEQLFFTTIDKAVQFTIDNMVKVENYGVCSIGKIHLDGKNHVISVGVLGHVFTIDKKDLEKEINKRIQSELNTKTGNSISHGIKGLIEKGVIDPLANSLKGVVGSAIDDIINEISGNTGQDDSEPTDSI